MQARQTATPAGNAFTALLLNAAGREAILGGVNSLEAGEYIMRTVITLLLAIVPVVYVYRPWQPPRRYVVYPRYVYPVWPDPTVKRVEPRPQGINVPPARVMLHRPPR